MSQCPECAGLQMAGHPGGLLMVQHRNDCTMRSAEDARQVADYERWQLRRHRFTRPATATERELLYAFGFELPDQLTTTVRHITPGVRQRSWAHLTVAVPAVAP